MAVSHYDRLFRRIFSTLEAKEDLARNVLPNRYLERIHLESLQSEDESFIDEELKEHFTDLLMSFELKEEKKEEEKSSHSVPDGQSQCSRLYLYLLVDHKSRPHRWAPLQMLRYVSTIYNKFLRDHQAKNKDLPPEQKQPPLEKMPEVVPVIFYHGTADWNYPLEASQLIEPVTGGERNHIPRFKPLFYDLNLVENHKLIGSVQTVVGLVVLKFIRKKFTREIVRILVEQVRRLPTGSELAKAIYTVFAAVKERREIEEFLARAREMRYTDIEEGVMTFAQEVREEGIQLGEERGLKKGESLGKMEEKQEILKRLLARKFGLSDDEAEAINRIDNTQPLDAALDEIIDAEEKQQVLEKLGL